MMEEEYKRILDCHRDKFRQAVNIERLSSSLLISHILNESDWKIIDDKNGSERIDILIDILKTKGFDKFKRFCVILETTYPYMLNCMFLGMEPPKNISTTGPCHMSQNKLKLEQDKDINSVCGKSVVHRSVSMSEHESCKETKSVKSELRIVQRKYDSVLKKLKKMEQERTEKKISLDEKEDCDYNDSIVQEKERECELIKQKYEDAVKEVEIHRKKVEEVCAECTNHLMESEHFRTLHLVGLNKCDQLVREAQMLNQKLNSSEMEREKLKQDYEEIILLREQEKKEMSELRDDNRPPVWSESRNLENSEDSHFKFQIDVKEYEELEKSFTDLRKRFSGVTVQLENSEKERTYWKQQCAVTKRSLEKAVQENEVMFGRVHQAELHRDAAVKETDEALALQMKATRELTKLKDERNNALSEYRLVMSERDSVHKEIDRLQEDANKAQEDVEKRRKEVERLAFENESALHDLNNVQSERDKAMKELYLVKQRMKQLMSDVDELSRDREKAREDADMFREERDAARRERHEAIIHRDKILRECFEAKQRHETFKGDSKESEILRKQFDALSKELANALSEAEISKKRRDWSFNERDKMAKERDAAKTACDVLRKERDRAVSDLAALLKDTDQIRREQSKSMEELKSLRERISFRLETDTHGEMVTSMDSAIDTESCFDWVTELVVLKKKSPKDKLGFDVAANNSSIIITNVFEDSIAYGKLRVNDCVLRVNNVDVSEMEYEKAIEALNGSNNLNITVRRKKVINANKHFSIHLKVPLGKELGILIDENKTINWIKPGSVADLEKRLCLGDEILTVNGTPVDDLSQAETEDLLSSSILTLETQKSPQVYPIEPLTSLLVEVDAKIKKDSSIRERAEFKEAMLADSLSALQGSEKVENSEISSALLNELDEMAWLNDNSSIFSPSTTLNMSPSLTPLYEDREPTAGVLTCGNERIQEVSEVVNRRITTSSTEKSNVPSTTQSHTGTVDLSSSYSSRRHMTSGLVTSSVDGNNKQGSLDYEAKFTTRRKNRPRSAPVVRPDTLMMESNRIISTGNTTLPRRTHIHPPISPSDPLSLSPRPNHLSGRLPSTNPPAFSTLYRSQNNHLPLQAKSALSFSAFSELSDPSPSTVNVASHSSLPEEPEVEESVPDVRSRTWTQARSFLDQEFAKRYKRCTSPQTLPKSSKDSGRSSLPRQRRVKSTSSYTQSFNTIETQSIISDHSSCRLSSIESTSAQNTTHIQSTSAYLRDITPVIHINQLESDNGDKNTEKIRELHIEKNSFPLGIQISEGFAGGIFVTTVTEGSIAQKAGLCYGDQILEFNGINFRSATYGQAALILGQAGGSVRLMVQHNPQKLKENTTDNSNSHDLSQDNAPVGDSDLTPPVPRRFVPTNDVEAPSESRYITTDQTVHTLGLNILGGNATGIFVCDVKSPGYVLGIRTGDQILQFNGFDFTAITLEQATLELFKPCEKINMRLQYNSAKYNVIKDHPGDSLYVRAMFDHCASTKDQLSFKKDDILYITDTLYNGHVGSWKAWVVNKEDAQQRESGMIPSRMKADQILLLRLSVGQSDVDNKLAGRRSFFRRSKKGSYSFNVGHSQESSDTALSTCTELPVSYQNVERLDNHYPRPVIILGPLADVVSKKLATGAPYKFTICYNQLTSASEAEIKKAISEGLYLDYVVKDGLFYVTLMSTIKDNMDKVKHSILEVSPLSIEKLRHQRVHPIVIFVKFKSPKHIKEQSDTKNLHLKVSTKEARAMYEYSSRMEQEFRSEFTAVIPGSNINTLFSQIQDIVDEQQKKTLWIPVPSNLC